MGDTFFTTDNEILLRAHKDLLPVLCVQKNATKIVPTEGDFVTANCMSFGNSIGSITNVGTAMYDVRSMFEPGTPEYETLTYRIIATQHAQQNSIDRSKGIVSKNMCRAWRHRGAAVKTGNPMDPEIVATKKPYFMIYRYSAERSKYSKYRSKCEFDSMWKFGKTLDTLLNQKERTDRESEYLYWYKKNSPVSLGNCTMNRLCRYMEEQIAACKNAWKSAGDGFSCEIYRSEGVTYTKEQYDVAKSIIAEYSAMMKSVPSYAKAFRLDDTATAEYRASLTELVKEELYCNCVNQDVLCNIVIDITCPGKKSSSLAWSLVGDVMVRNLLKRNDGKLRYYIEDAAGEIDFGGVLYKEMLCDMEEEFNDRACDERDRSSEDDS